MNDFRTITIEGRPVGKQRHGFSNGHAYTKEETREYEKRIALMWRKFHRSFSFPKETPLEVRIVIYMYIPKSASRKDREKMLSQELRPLKKPDIDNVAKSILDGLNTVAWHDDSQVVVLAVKKLYSEKPRVVVGVREVKEAENGL